MGKLVVVPTPIGNLADMSRRAIEVLKEADLVLAEDTRQSSKLFRHYDISTKLQSNHLANEHANLNRWIEMIKSGSTLAIISDAGSPGISDPGHLLIREVIKEREELEVLPGPTALVTALLLSGFPSERFTFEGFLPHKKGRQSRLISLQDEARTMIFYESPHRLMKLLGEVMEFFGEQRQISVSRELTKLYEETIRGTVVEVRAHFEQQPPKGEIVVVVSGKHN